MLYEHYLDLTELAAARIAAAAALDEPARTQVNELLQVIDLLHREALQRLVERLRAEGAGAALDTAAADPVVAILLGLYGLRELDIPETPEPAPSLGYFPAEQLTVRRTRHVP